MHLKTILWFRLNQSRVHEIMHLSDVNPYIASTLVSGKSKSVHMPKQAGGDGPACGNSGIAGVSAFAFAGTNAHVLLRRYRLVPGVSVCL